MDAKPTHTKTGRPRKGSPKLVAELVAARLVADKGNVAAVARHFNVARSSVVEFVQARPTLLAVQADARESRLDDAESALDRAVTAGEGWAVCFFLKTQGKARGYVERQEVEQTNRTRLVIEEEVVDADGGTGTGSAQGAPAP